jgi:hypothetical protein
VTNDLDLDRDLDPQLKQAFDDRLGRFDVARRRRSSRTGRVLAVGIAAASLTLGGAAFAADVNTVAAANGAECAHVFAKVQLWVQSHAGDSARHQLSGEHHVIIATDGGCQH